MAALQAVDPQHATPATKYTTAGTQHLQGRQMDSSLHGNKRLAG